MTDQHECRYPDEIQDVKNSKRLRWVLIPIIAAILLSATGFAVDASLAAGSISTTVDNIRDREQEDRRDIRELRLEFRTLEGRNERNHSQEMESLGRIEERLEAFSIRLDRIEEVEHASRRNRTR
jgi:hypothetical protein